MLQGCSLFGYVHGGEIVHLRLNNYPKVSGNRYVIRHIYLIPNGTYVDCRII